MDNFKTFDDFDKYDNFFTIDKKLHILYGHYHPDDETLFFYRHVHNHKVQDCTYGICEDKDLLNNLNNEKYHYNNISDVEFVVKNLKTHK